MLQQDEDEEKILRVWANCPHCNEMVPYQPTAKEMAELRNEAILRLLKAEKVSFCAGLLEIFLSFLLLLLLLFYLFILSFLSVSPSAAPSISVRCVCVCVCV